MSWQAVDVGLYASLRKLPSCRKLSLKLERSEDLPDVTRSGFRLCPGGHVQTLEGQAQSPGKELQCLVAFLQISLSAKFSMRGGSRNGFPPPPQLPRAHTVRSQAVILVPAVGNIESQEGTQAVKGIVTFFPPSTRAHSNSCLII